MDPLPLKQPGADWGPRLWSIFHTMAEWSDRRDIVYRWKRTMELTAMTIPCEVCRRHMQDYLRGHSIFVRPPDPVSPPVMVRKFRGVAPPKVKGWIPTKGEEVKTAIRKGLVTFHNHVTRSKGGTDMPEEEALKLFTKPLLKRTRKLSNSLDSNTEWVKYPSGIRAQIINTKTKAIEMDYIIKTDKNVIHILNAVSPGWTSAIPFARWVIEQNKAKI